MRKGTNHQRIKIIRSATVPGTINNFCRGLLKELSETYDVVVVASPGEAMREIAEREGVKTIAVSMQRRISPIKDFISLSKLVVVFWKEQPTIVHSMTPKAGLLCMVAAWITRVPIRVHTFTGLVFPTASGLKKKILMMTDKITCACATNVIPEGEGVKSDLINNNITKKELRVLGFGNVRGIDLDFYSRRPEIIRKAEILKKSRDEFVFLYVGRIVRDKGIEELIEAFKGLIDKNAGGKSIRLILVGKFEDNLDPITEWTRDIIFSLPQIEFAGEKSGEELLAYYAMADCFVFPSHREGFPNVVIEAGAMGLPCIVTDINGSREIVRDNENGLIVAPKDTESLKNAMYEFANNNETLRNMASVTRKMVAERFDQKFVHECLLKFYKELVSDCSQKKQRKIVSFPIS